MLIKEPFTVKCYMQSTFKGIVHPKIKILSPFTHCHVVPNLFGFFYSDILRSVCFFHKV